MTAYDESKTTVDITKGNPVFRKCGKCGENLTGRDRHLCVRCMAAAGGAVTADMPQTEGNIDKKKSKQTKN